jgi:pimeloyl-ACP methyl ester carboxylesterase
MMSLFAQSRVINIEVLGIAVSLIGIIAFSGSAFAVSSAPAVAVTHHRFAVGAWEPRKTLEVDGVSIAYHDSGGSSPVLICLHAIGHGARDFQDLSLRLGAHYRVIALDFPGQGYSGSDSLPASGSRYTQILTQFIERLHLDGVTLLGNSIGGAVAVRYASLHPDRVRALVLCDSGGLGPPPDEKSRAYINSFVKFFATGVQRDPSFGPAFAAYYKTVLLAEPAHAERDRIILSAYEIAPVLEQAWQSFALPEESLWDKLPQIECPVLIAWVKSDSVISLKSNEPAFARFPNHHLEIFTGGHAAFLEDPDRFEQRLREFLATVYK